MTNMFRTFMNVSGFTLLLTGLSSTALAVDPTFVPELDPGSIGSAMTIATGAFFMLRGRRVQK